MASENTERSGGGASSKSSDQESEGPLSKPPAAAQHITSSVASPSQHRRSMSPSLVPCMGPPPPRLPSLEGGGVQTKLPSSMPPPPPRLPHGDLPTGAPANRKREASPSLPGQGSPLRHRRSVSPPLPGQGSPLPPFSRSVSPPLRAGGSPMRIHRSVSPPLDRGLSIGRISVRAAEGAISPPVLVDGTHSPSFKRSVSPAGGIVLHKGRALSPPLNLAAQAPGGMFRTPSPPVPWGELKGEKRRWPAPPFKEGEEKGAMGPPKRSTSKRKGSNNGGSYSDGGTSQLRNGRGEGPSTSGGDQWANCAGGGSESDTSSNDGGSVGGGGGGSSSSSRQVSIQEARFRTESPLSGITGQSDGGEAQPTNSLKSASSAGSLPASSEAVKVPSTAAAGVGIGSEAIAVVVDMFGDPVGGRGPSIRGGGPDPDEDNMRSETEEPASEDSVPKSAEEEVVRNGAKSGAVFKRPPVPVFKAPAPVQNGARKGRDEAKEVGLVSETAKPQMGPPPRKLPAAAAAAANRPVPPGGTGNTSQDSSTQALPANGAPIKKQSEGQAPPKPKTPPAAAPGGQGKAPYTPPDWSAPPGKPFKMEVLKEGAVVGLLEVSTKGAFMFGRSDRCDFMLEHATISRYHAVLQYRATGEAFIQDLGSTHGTFINKSQVKPRVHVPLRVGDIVRFGHSSRLYVFQGPTELMPEEGLSKAERRALRQLEAAQIAQEKAESLARARAAASEADGISWGQQEDAIDEEEDEQDLEELTWRTYSGPLTDKQQKTLEKVKKREEKMNNLRLEIDRIQSKEIAQGGLSQGQQTQVARNEQRLEVLQEELESLEETLNESIRESLGAKKKNLDKRSGKRQGPPGSDDDEGDSDEDEFYDRSGSAAKRRRGKKEDATTTGALEVGGPQKVETAESLLDKESVLLRERDQVQQQLQEEQQRVAAGGEEAKGGGEGEVVDALDAFMSNVSMQIDQDRMKRLQKELKALEEEVARIGRLLKIADPMGDARQKWTAKPELASASSSVHEEFRASEAKAAKEGALLAKPKVATGTKAGAAADASKATLATVFEQPLKDTPVKDQSHKPSISGADSTPPAPGEGRKSAEIEESDRQAMTESQGAKDEDRRSQPKRRRVLEPDVKGEGGGEHGASSGAVVGAVPVRAVVGPSLPPGSDVNEETEVEEWVPPVGQTGDGRTALNDKFGY